MTGDSVTYQRIMQRRVEQELLRKDFIHRIIVSVSAVCLGLILSLTAGSFMSKAKDDLQPNSYKYYTSIQIEKGDTLWSIAEYYMDENYSSQEEYIREVIITNHLMDEKLTPGGYLIVPYYSTEFK